jgi:sugar phosphate isomerase/epimerase
MQPSLKSTCFLVILLISLSRLNAQEIGLQLYSLRDQFAKDVPGTMAKVEAMGIREVEMAGTYGLEFPEMIKLIAKHKLQVISFGADFERLAKSPQLVADQARAYGAKFVVCAWIPFGDMFDSDDVNYAASVLNEAGKVMARNGLLLCYHPHGYEFQPYESGTVFDYMVDALDSRYVYFEMDVFWIKQAGQDPVALLKKYSTRWVLLHLKDRKRGTPNSNDGKAPDETNVVLGQGDVGIAAVMKEAKAMGIQHFFIEDESPKAEQQIPKSLAYLKTLK